MASENTRYPTIFLAALNILNFFDRYLAAAVLPSIISEFHLSNAQGGALVAAFVPGYIIFAPIFGYFAERGNRVRFMVVGILVWSLATLSTAFAHSFELLLLARIAVGVGEASFGAIAPGYLRDRIDNPLRLNKALSLYYSAVPVGAALGFVIGGICAGHYSWRYAFLLGGIPGIFFAIVLAKTLTATRPVEVSKNFNFFKDISSIMRVREIRWLVLGYILNSFALNGVAAFVSSYGVSIGFSMERIGMYFGIILCTSGFIGTFLGGYVASYLAGKGDNITHSMSRFIGLSSIISAPLLLLAFSSQNHTAFLLLCLFTELIVFAATAPVNTLIINHSPKGTVTLTQGVTIFLINIFAALPAPIIVGKLADNYSLSFALQGLAAVLLLSGVAWTVGGRAAKVNKG